MKNTPFFDQGLPTEVDPRNPQIPDPVPAWATDARAFEAQAEQAPNAPQGEQAATQYHDDARFYNIENDDAPYWYEVATLTIPAGEYGTIFGLETCCRGVRNVPELASADVFPELSPLSLYCLLVPPLCSDGPRFRLTLHSRKADPTRGGIAPFRTRFENVPMPHHPDLAPWGDGRFNFGRHNPRTRIHVPEGNTARLWVGVSNTLFESGFFPRWVGGRIVALSQSYAHNDAARANSRRGW